MGWFDEFDDAEFEAERSAGLAKGRKDAADDLAAGGMGRGWDGSRSPERSRPWTEGYEEAYQSADVPVARFDEKRARRRADRGRG